MHVHVEGVDADFRGSFGVKVHLQWQDQRRKAVTPAGASDGENNKLDKLEGRQYRWQGSGRVDAKIDGSAMDLELQFVKGRNARRASAAAASPTTATEAKEARLEVLSSAFNEGDIQRAHIQGFGPWGSLGTKLLPWVRGTIFVRWPVKVVGDFLVREMVEGGVLDDILKTAWEQGGQHVDVSTYSNILDTDREAEIKTPLDAASLSPPTPSPAATTPVNPPSTATAPSAASTPFRLHTHLIGPTRLHSFALPDFQPPLYRPGGTRAALQSFNLLTSELQLKFYESAFSSITFDRASLAFDPASANGSTTGGDLVVTVQELVVVLSSKFKLVADTSAVVAWTTGLKRLGEKGASTTKVEARSLQIRFGLHHVDAATRKKRNMATGGFPYELRESVMSPFTSIEPRFEMDSSFLKLGTELVNVITAGLKVSARMIRSDCVRHRADFDPLGTSPRRPKSLRPLRSSSSVVCKTSFAATCKRPSTDSKRNCARRASSCRARSEPILTRLLMSSWTNRG